MSPRQAEIVVLVARGLTDRKIADTLGISARTVSNYLTILYDLTGCDNRTQLALLVGPEYLRTSALPQHIGRVDKQGQDGERATPEFRSSAASGDSAKAAPRARVDG